MRQAINNKSMNKKKVLTKKTSKKKKLFKDPFLRELGEKKLIKMEPKTPPIPSTTTSKEADKVYSRTAVNKTNIARLLPKTRLQLPTHALRSARTFVQCPSMSVVTNEESNSQHHQLPVICSRGALNFHARRLGTTQRVDNEYRLGQVEKRVAGKIKIDPL